MLCIRPGSVGPLLSLGDYLHARWDENRAAVLEEIKRRTATDVPLDGLEDPGEYPDDGFGGISARFRTLRSEQVQAFTVRWKPVREVQDLDALAREAESLQAARDFIAVAVAEVVGLEDENGPIAIKAAEQLSEDDVAAIEGAGGNILFLLRLLNAARTWQHLPAEARKNSGGSHGRSSGSSIAAVVNSTSETSTDATGGLVPLGSGGRGTSQTPVPVV